MSNGVIKVGDVVRLKSGGRPMTVAKINQNIAHVVWMDQEGAKEYSFDVDVLKHV